MPLQATSGAASYDAFGGGVAAVPNYIEDVFSTYLYTGNGSTQTITNGIDLSTKGGLTWIKVRDLTYAHRLFDTARGATKYLETNTTNDQGTAASSLTAFTASGFSLGSTTQVNGNGATFASWTFRKQPKFFDVVTYTGNGSAQNIAHSLGSTPGCIIVKSTSAATGWGVYHRSVGNTAGLILNGTNASITDSGFWNNTSPTSTQFTVGSGSAVNTNGASYVAYLFAHNAGGFGLTGTDNVISCGSFTTDSVGKATVSLGYEPQFAIIKGSSAVTNWYTTDSMRGWTNQGDSTGSATILQPNTSDAEYANNLICYPTSTGFFANMAGNTTYIYIAIRRGPMAVPTSGTSVYNALTRSGTGATATVTAGITPVDLVISKSTDNVRNVSWWDRLRGRGNQIYSNSSAAEIFRSTSLTGFDVQNGYTVGADGDNLVINASGSTYVNWTLKRAPGFFDVVCYTGTGSNTTVTHNLGVVPELIIVKNRGGGQGSQGWISWNAGLPSRLNLLRLDTTAATYTEASARLNVNALPTATQFEVGTDGEVNGSGGTYVAYLFATCAGVSKCFNYTGNGSSQTINCGFTGGARWILIKRTDSTGDWYVWDSARGIVSGNDPHLSLNTTAAEVTSDDTIDTDSTGFVVNQVSATNVNVSSATYIGIAIA